MPPEWLHMLQAFEGNKADMLWKLKYVYTVSDVFDMLEASDALTMYESERQRIEKSKNN